MATFGDIAITVDLGPIVDGDLIAARWTMRATYTGGIPHATAPTGTKITFSGNDIRSPGSARSPGRCATPAKTRSAGNLRRPPTGSPGGESLIVSV